jgi:hypothetical protein
MKAAVRLDWLEMARSLKTPGLDTGPDSLKAVTLAPMESALMAAKAKLLKADANGVSLHDHLSSTLAKIITDDPEDALAMFEQISLSVKKQHVLPRKDYLQVRATARPARAAGHARANVRMCSSTS